MRQVLLVLILLVGGSDLGWSLTGLDLLKAIDTQVTFDTDFSAQYKVTQDRPGEGSSSQTMALFRRDDENKFTIVLLAPEIDQGKGYLKVGNNLWFYDPNARRFVLTSAKDRFQNSNARNSDFTRSGLASDYRVVSTKQEKLGRFDTQVLDLEAVHDGVTFPKTRLWVTADNLVRKSEDRSLSGQLLRTTAIPQYQKLGARWVPTTVVIVDHLRGRIINGVFRSETTTLEMTQPSLKQLSDLVFTQGYLEKVSR